MPIGLGTRRGRAVSLAEGAAPGAEPCPACQEPLFVWLETRRTRGPSDHGRRQDHLIDRCENCGLAVARNGVPSSDDAVEQLLAGGLRKGGRTTARFQNAASLQAWLGAESWAALADSERVAPARDGLPLTQQPRMTPSHHGIKPTPRAAAMLLARRGLGLCRVRHLLRPGIASMWLTLLNLLTFHRDFAFEAVSGRLRPGSGRGLAAFWIDVAVTLLAAVPTAILAVLLEGAAVIARRGGVIEIEAEPLPDPGGRPD